MWWRLVTPLVFILGPRLIPPVARRVRLAWKLVSDSRVPLLLRLLVPGTLVYFLTPVGRLPLVGPVGYILVLCVALWLLFNLAPRNVVESHAPWRANRRAEEPKEKDGSRVVEGSYQLVEEEEPPDKSPPK